MSTVMHPVGPQPPSVYWVRRVVVIVVLLAILGLLVWFLGGRGGGSSDGASPQPGDTATAGPSQSPDASPEPSGSKTSKPKPSKTASGSPSSSTAPVACKDAAIAVTASTDAVTYPVGSTPRLRMRITNNSDTACRRDVGAPANELMITLDGSQFWSSDDCNPGGDPDVVVLDPKQSYSVTYTWMGNQSKPGCPSGLPAAGAGTYELVGRNGDVMSEPQSFSLTET